MKRLFLIFFSLFLWGNFFFRNIDVWHGNGQFVQLSILILFCYSFFEKSNRVQVLNKSLGCFVLWAGLITNYNWIRMFSVNKAYHIPIFLPFFNLLCIILFYKLIVEYLDKESIERILKYLKYSIILMLFYCAIQFIGLDEFFIGLKGNKGELVGTIGNTRHLAGLLAIIQPIFFKKTRENILSLILLWMIIFLANSATGLVCAFLVVLFWLFFKNRKLAIVFSGLSILLIMVLYLVNKNFFYASSRLEIWQRTFDIAKNHFITGFGFGSFAMANIKKGAMHWRHLHNEYFQIVFELGLIGLLLVLWCIWDYFKTFISLKTDLTIKLASIFFGFCILSAVTFTAHLWLIVTVGMFAFSGLYCLKNEVLNA